METNSTINDVLLVGSRRADESTWVPRCSALQRAAIERACTGVKWDDDQLMQLGRYAGSGDLAKLTPETNEKLGKIVRAAQADLTASQAKRIWKRKVASLVLGG